MVEDLRLIELVGVTKEFDGYEAVSNMNRRAAAKRPRCG